MRGTFLGALEDFYRSDAFAQMVKNDVRYRWMRSKISHDMEWYLFDKTVNSPKEFDAAIDAMSEDARRDYE
jgi:hypothetical protein